MKSKELTINGLFLWVDYTNQGIESVIVSGVDDGTMNYPFKSVNVLDILEDDYIELIKKVIWSDE